LILPRMPHLVLRSLVLAMLAVLTLGLASPTQAFESRSGDVVTVPAGTTIDDDLIVTGETIVIAGRVTGDVYAFGRSVTLTGVVDRDFIAAGQQVTVDGVILGNLRAGGQQVAINGRIDGNTTVGGQFVTLGRQGALSRSLLAGGQDVTLLGPVGRGLTTGARSLHLGSTVGGDVQAAVSTLTADPEARIAGRLDYSSERPSTIPAGVVAAGVQYTQVEPPARGATEPPAPLGGLVSLFSLAWLLGSIVAGVLLVHFLPAFTGGTAAQVREHLWSSFGIGMLAIFAVPLAALIVAVTVIGLPLSLLAGLGYGVALYVGWLLLGLAAGGLLVEQVRRRTATRGLRPEWLVVVGLAMLYVLSHLPWIGGLATFIALCVGLGAVVRQLIALQHQGLTPSPLTV
jgi:hypothetical protein